MGRKSRGSCRLEVASHAAQAPCYSSVRSVRSRIPWRGMQAETDRLAYSLPEDESPLAAFKDRFVRVPDFDRRPIWPAVPPPDPPNPIARVFPAA